MSEKITMSKGIVCVLAFLTVGLFAAAGLFAAETRGLRVVAKDPVSGQQTEVKLYNKSYAVIIGIDQYPNLSFSEQLTYAVRDARGVEDVLRKNFKFDKIITLYNNQATKDNILKVLMEDLANELGEEDALFVFWAGHGNQETTRTGDLGYLIPYDGFKAKLQSNISMNTLKEDISKKLAAKHVFYVMDACYGGLLTATRGLEKQTKRDLAYLQEITREPVRQVLTAGGKDQEVLDGDPKGHSVFTGRLIEELENADDFITANELQARVKEKVFSDANARNHKQTPGYGALYGIGDFVFIPSLERKVEDTTAVIAGLEKELERQKAIEEAALKAKDESVRRKADIDRRQIQARLKAKQLRQQGLEEQRRKREQELREDASQQAELDRKKKENDERLARLKKEVEEKRKEMVGGTALAALSPQKALDEMQAIDRKIRDIRERFRNELKTGIVQIVNRLNTRYLKLADARKDEFESEQEFQARLIKEKAALDTEQAQEFTAYQDRLEDEYNKQIAPLIEELKKISGQEFTITAENLILELGTYDGATNTYPVSIKAKKPLEILLEQAKKTAAEKQDPKKYVMLASNANIPIPREEAREFKQHFQNNMLRAELTGNFETPENFTIAAAKIIDDATTQQYGLFTAKFVDLGNGAVYDSTLKLLWSKKSNYFGKEMSYLDIENKLSLESIAGLTNWRVPTYQEMKQMVDAYEGNTKHPFELTEHRVSGSGCSDSGYLVKYDPNNSWWDTVKGYAAFSVSTGEINRLCSGEYLVVWPVRRASAAAKITDDATSKQYHQYHLFNSRFVDLGNGTVFDSQLKLLWLKNADYFQHGEAGKGAYNLNTKQEWEDCKKAVESLKVEGLMGWRLPSQVELSRMFAVYHKWETHPFINIYGRGDRRGYITSDGPEEGVSLELRSNNDCWEGRYLWPVRGGQ